jgi:hypothetical protein
MIGEPFSPPGAKVIVPDTVSAGGRMDKPPVAGVYRDVADAAALSKEH